MNYSSETLIKRIATARGFRDIFYLYLSEFSSQKECFTWDEETKKYVDNFR